MKLIELNIHQIVELCKKFNVKKLYVFGSILTPHFNDKSDIDFAVEFDAESIDNRKIDWADNFFDFMHSMENLLKRKVDIVFDNYINNEIFRRELDSTKHLIYG